MTYPEKFDHNKLRDAVKHGHFYSCSLQTNEISAIGITDEDDVAQVRDGGRFDLTPWSSWKPPKPSLLTQPVMTPMHVLHDASNIAPHLYLQYEHGENGTGDISATYNAEPNTTIRTAKVDLTQP